MNNIRLQQFAFFLRGQKTVKFDILDIYLTSEKDTQASHRR